MNIQGFFMDKDGDPNLLRIGLLIAAIIVTVGLLLSMMVVVGAGRVAVIYDPLSGGVQSGELNEGLHFIMPWQSVSSYNIKLQDYTMSSVAGEGTMYGDDKIQCVTSEGLYLDLDITVWFRIDPTKASDIRQTIGRDGEYQTIVVRPAIRSAIREVIATREAVDVYGIGRSEVAADVETAVIASLEDKDILVQSVLLRDVTLPQQLVDAIEAKKQAEQSAQRMVYVLQEENLERHRRVIEAEGISSANDIIAGSLTNEYLTWYWISNLESHESVLYVPVGDSGIPLFREVSEPNGGA